MVREGGHAEVRDGRAPLSSDADAARLREEIAELRRQLDAARTLVDNAAELARVAQLVNETLDLTTVAERIAASVLTLLGVHSSAIRLLRPDGMLAAVALGGQAKSYGAGATVPMGVGLIGRAAFEGRPMWTEDFRVDARFETSREIRERNTSAGIIAGLAVPLRAAGKVIGVLSVGSPTPRVFTGAEVDLLQRFADQAALAINNAQTQEALARQAERLRILHEIDRALMHEEAPEAIAAAVVRPLQQLLDIPRVIVNTFDLAAGQVEWIAAAGRRRVHSGPGVRYPLALAGNVEGLQRGEPQVMDVDALPDSPHKEALLAGGCHAYVVVPMIAAGELIGSVSLADVAGPFPPERIAIAQEVATQLAIAMAQARLHRRVKRQAEELEVRVEERTRELSAATAEADRANRAKSDFLSRMSHELRTPLNAILGFAQLLEMDVQTEENKESVGQILRAGRHLLGLINEVLDISRIEAGALPMSPEAVPVAETLRQAIELVRQTAATARVEVRADAIDEGLHVLADRQRLQQVLLNLLSNAIKYNRARGSVRVACAPAGDGRVAIHVTDTGSGIAPDKLERLFTPFDRLGAEAGGIEGTGLGLALSKSLVEAMGGTMRVQSRVGTGSTFTVELAQAPAPALVDAITTRAVAAARGEAPARTILYIEDNLSNLRLVESVLKRRPGVSVLSAMQGRVGLDLARDHRPDVILLDRHLPDMTGDDVFQRLRDDPRTREIPVIVLSADAIPARVRRMLDAGVRAYLSKPLDVHSLLAAVDAALGLE